MTPEVDCLPQAEVRERREKREGTRTEDGIKSFAYLEQRLTAAIHCSAGVDCDRMVRTLRLAVHTNHAEGSGVSA